MKRVILIGGGYSVKEAIDQGLWDKIKDEELWSLNYAFTDMPYLPKRQVWVDEAFFRANMDALEGLFKKGVECHAKASPKYNLIKAIKQKEGIKNLNELEELIKWVKDIKDYYISRDQKDYPDKIFYGRMGLCGCFALSLAISEGYDEIYLLGYDFGTQSQYNKKTHWYQDNVKVESTGVENPLAYRNKENLEELRPEVEDFKFFTQFPSKVYNVSPISNIDAFPKINYEEMFRRLKDG